VAQGFLFSEPLPPEEMAVLLTTTAAAVPVPRGSRKAVGQA
jgi:hypothetical protein